MRGSASKCLKAIGVGLLQCRVFNQCFHLSSGYLQLTCRGSCHHLRGKFFGHRLHLIPNGRVHQLNVNGNFIAFLPDSSGTTFALKKSVSFNELIAVTIFSFLTIWLWIQKPPSSFKQCHMVNGRAPYSTLTTETEKVLTHRKETQVADANIIRTFASYLWMKDNLEFRLRVVTAVGFLVGAKVGNVFVNFCPPASNLWFSCTYTVHALSIIGSQRSGALPFQDSC